MMKTIQLGKTSEQISCMGLGTMYFGSKLDQATSFELLDAYAESGGSFLDSANKYASWVPGFDGGESETIIGAWLKSRGNQEQMFLTSKVGFPYQDIPRSLNKDIIISECDRSLQRLGVDQIDLYFAHAYDVNTPAEEVVEAFQQLQQSGKIRYAGASNYQSWQLMEFQQASQAAGFDGYTCLQQRHSYLEPGTRANFGNQLFLTPELESFCASNALTVMAYSPLLNGSYNNTERPFTIQYQSVANDYRLQQLNAVADQHGVTPHVIVLAWMLQNTTAAIQPLITGSTVAQIQENLKALNIELSEEQMKQLNSDPAVPEKFS